MREESAGNAMDTAPAYFLRFKFVNYLKPIEILLKLSIMVVNTKDNIHRQNGIFHPSNAYLLANLHDIYYSYQITLYQLRTIIQENSCYILLS